MKKGILFTGIAFLLANIVIGLIASSYNTFNICLSSAIIAVTTLLLWGVAASNIKDAFKIALTFFFAFLGLVEFVLAVLSPEQYNDNWYLIAIILLIITESVFVIFGSLTSKH